MNQLNFIATLNQLYSNNLTSLTFFSYCYFLIAPCLLLSPKEPLNSTSLPFLGLVRIGCPTSTKINKLSVTQRFSSESIERSYIDALQCTDIREIMEYRSFLCLPKNRCWLGFWFQTVSKLLLFFCTILHVKTFSIILSKGIAEIQADS